MSFRQKWPLVCSEALSIHMFRVASVASVALGCIYFPIVIFSGLQDGVTEQHNLKTFPGLGLHRLFDPGHLLIHASTCLVHKLLHPQWKTVSKVKKRTAIGLP